MAKSTKTDFHLIKQQRALMVYLDALLTEVDDLVEQADLDEEQEQATETAPAATAPEQGAPLQAEQDLAGVNAAPPLTQETLKSLATSVPLDSKSPAQNLSIPESVQRCSDEAQSPKDEKPDWATSSYQVLSFELAGLSYSAPLERLFGIIPMPDMITQMPGSPAWFMGLHRNRDVNVKLINFARLLHPESPQTERKSRVNTAFILLVGNGRWGMVVDRVDKVLTLRDGDVTWRRNPGGVIVGTVVEKMCSLLDVDRLVENLDQGDYD